MLIRALSLILILLTVLPVQAIELSGNPTQGGLLRGKTVANAKVWLNDQPVRVSADGYFLIGFGRDAKSEQILTISLPDGDRQKHQLNIAARQYDEQRIDGIPPAKVTPPETELARIQQEAELMQQARQRDSDLTGFLNQFSWPAQGRISGVYGSRRILNGTPKNPHYGVDVAAPTGTPVYAPADGVVTLAYSEMFFNGNTIIIDHGHGLASTFIHLDKILVKPDTVVKQGQQIGTIGTTGRSTGSHLHWALDWFKTPLDPMLLVGAMPTED